MWAEAERNGGTSQKSTREGNVTRDGNRTRREVAETGRRWIKTKSWRGRGRLKASARRVGGGRRLAGSGHSLLPPSAPEHRLQPHAATGCKFSTTAGRCGRQRQRRAVTLACSCGCCWATSATLVLLRLLVHAEQHRRGSVVRSAARAGLQQPRQARGTVTAEKPGASDSDEPWRCASDVLRPKTLSGDVRTGPPSSQTKSPPAWRTPVTLSSSPAVAAVHDSGLKSQRITRRCVKRAPATSLLGATQASGTYQNTRSTTRVEAPRFCS